MKSLNFSALVLLAGALTLSACKKEEVTPPDTNPPTTETGQVKIVLEHQWGSTSPVDFELNTALTHPVTGDELTFTTFKYYISNFKLKKQDGTWWTHPESYFLVDGETATSATLNLTGVPVGTYTEVSYIMGVDSTRNVSGAQSGALATTNNMFWSWSTGYIMVKAEGSSPQATGGAFAYHLGGFSGPNSLVTTKNAVFGAENLVVTGSSNGKVHFTVDASQLFQNFGSVSNGSIHMPGANAKLMATDFYTGVVFDHVHN